MDGTLGGTENVRVGRKGREWKNRKERCGEPNKQVHDTYMFLVACDPLLLDARTRRTDTQTCGCSTPARRTDAHTDTPLLANTISSAKRYLLHYLLP